MTLINDNLEKDACKNLADAVNVMSFSSNDFLKEFDNTHRYLQGSIYTLALAIIKHCAENDYRYDDRNEWCHKSAMEIVSSNPKWF